MRLAHLGGRMLFKKLYNFGSVTGRRRKVPLANGRLKVLYRNKGRSTSSVVAFEGLDKLSRSPP
jgi:hypothetical protein